LTASTEKKTFKQQLLNVIAVMFCMGVIVCCIISVLLTIFIATIIKEQKNINVSNMNLNFTTIIYANNAQAAPYEVCRFHNAENRIWVSIDDIPEYVGNAAIAIEDQRFMHHNGVDFKRTLVAFLNEFLHIFGGRQGGSTITQQLIKNVTGDKRKNALRKIKEIISALYLEKKNTKQEILEAYLNVVYFGHNTNGIEAAANLYFNKPAKDLTLQESASIIAITKYPVKYDPFLHPENNKGRREQILKKMLDFEFITKEEYEKAVSEELPLADGNHLKRNSNVINNYFVDYVINNVINDLMKQYGFTRQYATKQVYNGGYRIYTTMDESVQMIMENKISDHSIFSHVRGSNKPLQAAMVVMEPNGAIKGMVGGTGEKKANRCLNRAADTYRQPGSAFKPIAVYTLAIEKNLLNYSSLVCDKPFATINGNPWPHNAYDAYWNNILLPRALEQSSNAVAVDICNKLGPEKCFNFVKDNFGLNLTDKMVIDGKIYTDKNLASMGLGALTKGVSVVDLTGAFQIFANGGNFNKPYAYTKVIDSKGHVVLENNAVPIHVISSGTASSMNYLLQDVVDNGTGRAAKLNGRQVYGKTGTTSYDKDVWFIGGTTHYIGGIWVGYDIPKPMQGLWPHYPPTNLWHNVMLEIHKKIPVTEFEIDKSSTKKCAFCTNSGMLATPHCKNQQIGVYKIENTPQPCTACEKANSLEQQAAATATQNTAPTQQPPQ
jgi:penicillin-binding protein 1A